MFVTWRPSLHKDNDGLHLHQKESIFSFQDGVFNFDAKARDFHICTD